VDGRWESEILSPEPALAVPWRAGDFAMAYEARSCLATRLLLLVVLVFLFASTASAEWKEKVLYSFQGGTDGSTPAGGVIFDKAGNLYGLTIYGGSTACPPGWCGTFYQVSPPLQKGGAWTETVLYVFKGHDQNDGSSPSGSLIADGAGNFYGVTGYGGSGPCVLFGTATGCGTVFELTPPKTKGGAWTEEVLYNFQGGNDGDLPTGPLVFDSAGNLYGATEFGGGKGTTCDIFYGGNCGTVFKLSPPKIKTGKWTEKVLHSFAGGTDGAVPNGGLVLDSKGAAYGTTLNGGNQGCKNSYGIGCGTAFKLAPPSMRRGMWREKMLHRFEDGDDGASPNSGFILDPEGALYGTAGTGGAQQDGVVFRLTRQKSGNWAETVIHTFTDNAHGRGPSGPVRFDSAGNLYGVAGWGQYFAGVVYRLVPPKAETGNSWSYALPYEFKGTPDAAYPEADLIFDAGGNLYSTTQGGGTGRACQGGCGTVFEVEP
jgi:uncharacterized repeat protein (TIGR03803 family)